MKKIRWMRKGRYGQPLDAGFGYGELGFSYGIDGSGQGASQTDYTGNGRGTDDEYDIDLIQKGDGG